MGNFLTHVDCLEKSSKLAQVDDLLLQHKFYRHLVNAENMVFALPQYTYFSFGELTAIEVRNLAINILDSNQIKCNVISVAFYSNQIAWRLSSFLPVLPAVGTQSAAQEVARDGVSDQLLSKIEQTMDKVRPLAETTSKISSDFGQILIKGCTTLNAGALIALPTFYRALAGNEVAPRALYTACKLFASGLAAGAVAAWIAFVFASQVSKLLTRSLQVPILKAQQAMYPDSMDQVQLNRLSKAEFSIRWQEAISNVGLWTVSIACLVSVICLILGAYQGALATLR